jgi:hypothetical protein
LEPQWDKSFNRWLNILQGLGSTGGYGFGGRKARGAGKFLTGKKEKDAATSEPMGVIYHELWLVAAPENPFLPQSMRLGAPSGKQAGLLPVVCS